MNNKSLSIFKSLYEVLPVVLYIAYSFVSRLDLNQKWFYVIGGIALITIFIFLELLFGLIKQRNFDFSNKKDVYWFAFQFLSYALILILCYWKVKNLM